MLRCTAVALALSLPLLIACDEPIFASCETGPCDAGRAGDAGSDAGADDAGADDAGADDAGADDAGADDAGADDAGADAGWCEEREEGIDYADCISAACPRSDTSAGHFRLGAGETDSRFGRIDDATHTLANPGCGGATEAQDVDWLQFEAPPRSIVEVELTQQCPMSSFRPWLAMHDSLRLVHLTASEAPERVRLVFVQPYRALPAYLLVSDLANADSSCTEPVGGVGYGYEVTARVTDRGPVELGTLGATDLSVDGAIERPGDLEFYRVVGAAGQRARVHVALIDDACPTDLYDPDRRLQRCVLHLLRLDPFDGNSHPVSCDFDEADVWGSPRTDELAFVEERVVDVAASGEILFAVTDWHAAGAAGYAYRVTVSLDPSAPADSCTAL